jgi:hypothetical protein
MAILYVTGLGPGSKETPVGPVSSSEDFDKAIEKLKSAGCTGIECGGPADFRSGNYGLHPRSIADLKGQMKWDRPKDNIFFSRFDAEDRACLKVIRGDGQELSIAGDDSCGKMQQIGRISACRFASDSSLRRVSDDNPVQDGVDLLIELADFLGYHVEKNEGSQA